LHIPVGVEAKSRNAETILSMAELDGVKGDKANSERLASAGEVLVPVHHGWCVKFFEEESSKEGGGF
jgi:hypothetical protein